VSIIVTPIPDHYRALVDDAAIFPPGNAELPQAVSAHREYKNAPYTELVGAFVISDIRLPELIEVLVDAPGAEHSDPLPVSVVVTGGAGSVEPAVRWAVGAGEVDLRCIELALRDESDLAHNARRFIAAVEQVRTGGHLGEDVTVHVETPRLFDAPPTPSWLVALDEIAAMNMRLKFRMGGASAESFPSSGELAACIAAALDRELPFKCTAGLHNALRHRDAESGFEHHGFLNVLLATRASLDGAAPDDVEAILDASDAKTITRMLDETGSDGLTSARRWFTSFGSCSVLEPLRDLVELDLLPDLKSEYA